MYFSKTLIAAVAATCTFGTTFALPKHHKTTPSALTEEQALEKVRSGLHKRDGIPLKTQSCVATDWYDLFKGYGAVYEVSVGIGYANGKGCDAINKALNDATAPDNSVWDYSCTLIEGGMTGLSFSTLQGYGDEINTALVSMYPTVNGFNCPDY